MIAIIDYGIGNLRSVEKALLHVGGDARLTADPTVVRAAHGVVVPGVGAFGACALGLRSGGFESLVLETARTGKPLLGICVGMQLLFESSEEMGQHAGLGLLPGQVLRFPEGTVDAAGQRLKVPQIGWNQLHHDESDPLLAGVPAGSFAYFVHSYYCAPAEPSDVIATTDYGLDYASIVRRDNLWGVQFHPEKSQAVGLQILRNFVAITADRRAV
ncbi:MAG TPA: imidazole glycerol phosphate synthase subunit HisH [Anaerolineae bacterium]|nr:imidazole glycerol phosphate synthase subunit HisH [Anaerolineae bacterium]